MDNDRIDKLESRIAKLEKEIKILKGEKEFEQVSPHIEKRDERVSPVTPPPSEKLSPQPIQQRKEVRKEVEKKDLETLLGKVWLPRIFIFILLLGVIWGFKIAVDAGWLNEVARVIIGFVAAGVLFYLGDKQIKKERTALGKVLLVGCISILLVTTFAMHILYGMIPMSVAFPLNIVWIALGLYLSHLHRSQAMGVMFAITGFLIPFLVSGIGTFATITMVISYELIYYLALLWFATRKEYRILFYVSTIILHVIYFALIGENKETIEEIHFLFMSLGIIVQHETIFFTLLKEKLAKLRAFPLLFTSFAVTMIWAKLGFDMIELSYLFTLYVVLSTLRYGWMTYQAKLKEKKELFSLSMVLATLGVSVLIIELFENITVLSSLYLIQGTLAVYLGYRFKSIPQKIIGYFVYYIFVYWVVLLNMNVFHYKGFLLWGILIGTFYFQVIFSKAYKDKPLFQANLFIALFVHVLFLFALNYDKIILGPLYWAFIIGSLFVLYKIVRDYLDQVLKRIYLGVNVLVHLMYISYLADEFITMSTNWNVLMTTLGFALYAFTCVLLGMRMQHKSLRMLGIGLIFFALVKLIFVDLVFISLATRSLLFVLIGLIGIVISRVIYGKNKE